MLRSFCASVLVVCLCGCTLAPPSGNDNNNANDAAPFALQVVPAEMTDTVPDQRCVLLVTMVNEDAAGAAAGPVRISASAPGAAVLVEHEDILPGEVAEVTVIPDRTQDPDAPPADGGTGRTVTATIQAERAGLVKTKTVPLTISSEEEELVEPTAAEVRDLFIPWLAENHPELGITEDTEWTGTIVTLHILVVTHYLFFSDAWEMHVYWHVMIPPYDWARIELRRRFVETAPSLAFEISSRSADPPLEATAIEPSESCWR